MSATTASTATNMRDLPVSSPKVAFTVTSSHNIDENQNRSGVIKGSFGAHNMCTDFSDKAFADSSSEDLRRLPSSSPSSGNESPLSVSKGDLRSMSLQDCSPSNNHNSNSPQSSEMTSRSPHSDDHTIKYLRSARRASRGDDGGFLHSAPSAESTPRRKPRSVNNNESTEEEPHCPVCALDFCSWSVLISHLKTVHPDQDLACELCHITFDSSTDFDSHRSRVHKSEGKQRKAQSYESPKFRIDRKHLRNIPKVIGFKDINFIDFSSEKFPLVAKDVCEKRLHLSKDEFCFECHMCGLGFPCPRARDMHMQTCQQKKIERGVIRKNKRKSTPQFRPQTVRSESEESDIDMDDKRRNDFFNSLHLRNNESSSKSSSLKSSEDEAERLKEKVILETRDSKDLADIESMISVTNIPGINMKNFQIPPNKPKIDEKHPLLNITVDSCQSSPRSLSTLSLNSPSFSVLSLRSPNPTTCDFNEEEAQDCFASECRRMKLRGEFPCKLCSQIFPNLRALKGHNRVHVSVSTGTPSSPYRCNICPYSSLDKSTLVRHMRSHNGDRPYECAMCNYAFTTKANCERHLRNRHSKMTRDDVKGSIIYHPSEDPINDSEYMKTSEMNKRNVEKTKDIKPEFSLPMNLKLNLAVLKDRQRSEDLFQSEHQHMLQSISNGSEARMEAATMTDEVAKLDSPPMDEPWSGEEALDLRVNKFKYDTPPSECSDEPEDLTKRDIHIKEFNNNNDTKNKEVELSAFPSPPFEPKQPDISTLVKMYSAMHPSLSLAQVQQIIFTQINFPGWLQRLSYPQFLMGSNNMFPNASFAKSLINKEAGGLQMSGGSIMDDANDTTNANNKMHYFQQESLAKIMINREKDRIANDFYKQSSESTNKQLIFKEYFTETDKKAFQDILINREAESKPEYPVKTEPDQKNSSVKMVIKNGVLMPKQKQRRYRTERPFSCEHCSARFTLRSNMERHIKQQHPRFWTQKSRYNIGQSRKSGLDDYYKNYDAGSVSRSEVSSTAGDIHWDAARSPEKKLEDAYDESEEDEPKAVSDEEESKDDLVIDEENGNDHLRLLANVTEYLKVKEDAMREPQPQDLASVSKMLDNAVTQTQAFQKYFQENGRKDEEERRREEAERSEEEEEGLIAGSTSSDENKSESEVSSKATKKKSAYSLAPNRVHCPYCFRKFPWTSSLRRHVLTHTGQKPFKCTHCPLLFTTKSNCDRHLLRKHGREALIASSGHTENHEGAGPVGGNGNMSCSQGQPSSQNPNLRNVPERPYKCSHCPASTFSSLSNLTKHIVSKHPDEPPPEAPPSPTDHSRVKNLNPLAPPNVTISPTFPIIIPKALSIIPQFPTENKPKRFPINVPSVKMQDWGDREHSTDEARNFRKRSSSDETDASERKRSSPDILKVSPGMDSHSDNEMGRGELPQIPPSELPFKCHLCEGSFGERSDALDHIRSLHPGEFQLLISKGALETTSEEDRTPPDDHEDIEHSRGRFPDYAHRKVMCAFCMRRFWSAEDLRRHMRTHTGERPFSCDVCHRKFTLKHSMLRHRKKHSAHDELLVGSDEEQHSSVVGSTSQRLDMDSTSQLKTILHQTLTRKEDDRPTLEPVK